MQVPPPLALCRDDKGWIAEGEGVDSMEAWAGKLPARPPAGSRRYVARNDSEVEQLRWG